MAESSPDPQRSRTNPNTPETPPNPYQELRSEVLLRTGITFFAVLAGLACYYGALHFGFNHTLATVAGLVFALLVWIAARSLLRDALRGAAPQRTPTDRRP